MAQFNAESAEIRRDRRGPPRAAKGRREFILRIEEHNAMLRRIIATSSTWFTLPIRLALAAVMIAHGSQKVLGSFNGPGFKAYTAGSTPFAFMRPTWLWL